MFCTFPPVSLEGTSMLQSQVSPSGSAHPSPHARGDQPIRISPPRPSRPGGMPSCLLSGSTSVSISSLSCSIFFLSIGSLHLPFLPPPLQRVKNQGSRKTKTQQQQTFFSFPFPSNSSPKLYSTSLRSGSPQLLTAPSYLKCSSPLPPFLLSS